MRFRRIGRGSPILPARRPLLSAGLACLLASACAHPHADTLALATPQEFAPGVISTGHEFAVTFSPDGSTVLFVRSDSATRRAHIYSAHRTGGTWTTPQALGFSDASASDLDPSLSPDGKRLYFVSTRPHQDQTAARDMDIWFADAIGNGWGEPHWIAALSSTGKEGSPTEDRNGTLCFFSDRGAPADHNAIYCADSSSTGFTNVRRLGSSVNRGPSDTSPFLCPDGRTLFFYSTRDGGVGQADLYVSRKAGADWGEAVSLGPRVNTAGAEYNPVISRDGRTLLFGRSRRIYSFPIDALPLPHITCTAGE